MALWLYERTLLLRRPIRPLSAALLLCALMLFPPLLARQADVKCAAVENALDSIPVSVVLSDIRGTGTEDIGLPRTIGDGFFDDRPGTIGEYVYGVLAKSSVCYSIGGEGFTSERRLIGLSALEAERGFTPAGGNRIEWLGCEGESLFYGSREACAAPKELFSALEPDHDGVYRVRLRLRPYPAAEMQETQIVLKVAGVHDRGAGVYCPLGLIRRICTDMAAPMYYDSLRAEVKSNRGLPALKALLSEHFAGIDPFADPYEYMRKGVYAAAVIHDEQLNQTVDALEKDIRTLETLKPFLLISECAAAGFASFFLVHSRRRELALACALGVRMRAAVIAAAAELLILLVPGAAVRTVIFGFGAEAAALGSISVCTLSGGCAAALAAGARRFELLKESE